MEGVTFENVGGLSVAAVFAVTLLAMLREKFKDDRAASVARELCDRELARERIVHEKDERIAAAAGATAERELARERIAQDLKTGEALTFLADAVQSLTHHVYELRQDVGGVTPPVGVPTVPSRSAATPASGTRVRPASRIGG